METQELDKLIGQKDQLQMELQTHMDGLNILNYQIQEVVDPILKAKLESQRVLIKEDRLELQVKVTQIENLLNRL